MVYDIRENAGYSSYSKTDYIHDLVKNVIIGAGIYFLADKNALAGAATAGIFSVIDTKFYHSSYHNTGGSMYHLLKDIMMMPIAAIGFGKISGKENLSGLLLTMVGVGSIGARIASNCYNEYLIDKWNEKRMKKINEK